MNINMTGFRLFRVFLCVCPLDGSNLSIAKVNTVDNDEDFCNANIVSVLDRKVGFQLRT